MSLVTMLSPYFILAILLPFCQSAALPPLGLQAVLPGSPPTSPNANANILAQLLVPRFSCTYNSGNGCTNQECCALFTADLEGFCCTGNCCGNGCCAVGYYCVYADYTSASSCCPSGSSCAPPAAQTIFKTNIEVQTAMVTQTDLQTTQDTVLVTGAGVTVQQTQTQTQTQIQTQAESFTIMQTVNAAGQTVQQTTIPIPPAAASSTSATSNPPSSPSNAGAIAGGAVGVTVVLAACALLLFVGVRKGWFDRKASTTDEKTAGDITQAPGGRAESFPSEMAAKKPRAAVVEIDRMTFGALGRPRVRSGVSSWLS